jgi:hypothetical protein
MNSQRNVEGSDRRSAGHNRREQGQMHLIHLEDQALGQPGMFR